MWKRWKPERSKPLSDRLRQIENRLQSLVEDHVARMFSFRSGSPSANLIRELVNAMHSAVKNDPSGRQVAPNLFFLELNPALADKLHSTDGLLDELAQALQESGLEIGLNFESPLVIQVVSNAEFAGNAIQVKALHSSLNLTDTTAVTSYIEPGDQHHKLPLNAFLVVDGTELFLLSKPLINIGRRTDNHLVIDDPRISRTHAQLRAVNGQFMIFDLNSTGGTYVNGESIRQKILQPGDVISLSGLPLVYGEDASYSDETQELKARY